MDNRKILQQFLDVFNKNDIEGILGHMTDDVQWTILEDRQLTGKEAVRKFLYDYKDIQVASATRDHFIVEGDHASVGGEAVCRNVKSGEEFDMYYCDVYQLQNGKIRNMVTYIVIKNKN